MNACLVNSFVRKLYKGRVNNKAPVSVVLLNFDPSRVTRSSFYI